MLSSVFRLSSPPMWHWIRLNNLSRRACNSPLQSLVLSPAESHHHPRRMPGPPSLAADATQPGPGAKWKRARAGSTGGGVGQLSFAPLARRGFEPATKTRFVFGPHLAQACLALAPPPPTCVPPHRQSWFCRVESSSFSISWSSKKEHYQT